MSTPESFLCPDPAPFTPDSLAILITHIRLQHERALAAVHGLQTDYAAQADLLTDDSGVRRTEAAQAYKTATTRVRLTRREYEAAVMAAAPLLRAIGRRPL